METGKLIKCGSGEDKGIIGNMYDKEKVERQRDEEESKGGSENNDERKKKRNGGGKGR